MDVAVLTMAGDGYNHWLEETFGVDEVSDPLGRFVTIHYRHLTIHQDQRVVAAVVAVQINVAFYFLESLLTIHREAALRWIDVEV